MAAAYGWSADISDDLLLPSINRLPEDRRAPCWARPVFIDCLGRRGASVRALRGGKTGPKPTDRRDMRHGSYPPCYEGRLGRDSQDMGQRRLDDLRKRHIGLNTFRINVWVANYYSARNPLRLSSLVILGVVARMFRCATRSSCWCT